MEASFLDKADLVAITVLEDDDDHICFALGREGHWLVQNLITTRVHCLLDWLHCLLDSVGHAPGSIALDDWFAGLDELHECLVETQADDCEIVRVSIFEFS